MTLTSSKCSTQASNGAGDGKIFFCASWWPIKKKDILSVKFENEVHIESVSN